MFSGCRCTTIEGNTRSIFISSLLKAPLLNNLQRKCLPIEIVSDKWINIVINRNVTHA